MKMRNQIRGGVLGFAVGDALGVPVEFTTREDRKEKPVTEMLGFGTYPVPAGTWSDDTGMTLALLDSLTNGFQLSDMMYRLLLWRTGKEYTAAGEVFDIGRTTELSLFRYENGVPVGRCGGKEERDNGNGGLMRILPQVLYELKDIRDQSSVEHLERIYQVTALTHAHRRSLLASGIYYFIIKQQLLGADSIERCLKRGFRDAREYYNGKREWSEDLKCFDRLLDLDGFMELPEEKISSSGYVVDTLEAAVWCLQNSKSYEECVLKAVNLGGDTDTIAAIAGSMAGIWYGSEAIPQKWLETLARRDWIEQLCERFAEALEKL